jgi:hypothetical protein
MLNLLYTKGFKHHIKKVEKIKSTLSKVPSFNQGRHLVTCNLFRVEPLTLQGHQIQAKFNFKQLGGFLSETRTQKLNCEPPLMLKSTTKYSCSVWMFTFVALFFL